MVLFVHQFYQLTQNPSIIDQKFEKPFSWHITHFTNYYQRKKG